MQDWIGEGTHFIRAASEEITEDFLLKLKADKTAVLVLSTENPHAMAAMRQVFMDMLTLGVKAPVILERGYTGIDEERFILYSSTDIGGLLADGFGDGVWLTYQPNPGEETTASLARLVNRTAFNILQAARTRISRTEYISCPSCGRTLFDLQETTAMIRARTDHLKGVKIAIMGCIVNGPGEMADADYGYVGTGVGKITLYRGKEVVKRNIDSRHALDELINLIREDGLWVEKQELVS
jgi:(E)-4-hydroxy-3-methylbut-2-enyl-diphosphate synthase